MRRTASRPRSINLGSIVAAHKHYLSSEGHRARGPNFEELVSLLDSPTFPGKEETGRLVTISDALELLGPPDLVKQTAGFDEWLYFYDRFGTLDWFVLARFDKDNPYAEFYYNASSTLDKTEWKPYQEAKMDATRE